MRITTTMVSSQYASNLNKSMSTLNDSLTRSLTGRAFQKTSEDPYAAAKAYRLRRESAQNEDYQSTLTDVKSQLTTASSTMQSIYSDISEANTGDTIQAITDTMSSSDRATIANKLRTVQEGIVTLLNTEYSDKYLFGGANTDDPPFSLGEDGNLLYQGVDVTTGEIEAGTTTTMNGATITFGDDTGILNGYTIKVAAGTAGSADSVSVSGTEITVTMDLTSGKTNKDLLTALKGATGLTDTSGNALDFSDATISGEVNVPLADGTTSVAAYDNIGEDGLKALANETAYVDLGLGLSFNSDGTINSQSVFDTAIPGLSFMGYGTDDDTGLSNNLYTLLGDIATQLESDDYSYENIEPYLTAFSDQSDVLLGEITKTGTKSDYLSDKLTNLQTIGDNLTEKSDDVEYVDTAEAYIEYTQLESAWNAALQMGESILLPTFLDFMD